MSEGLLLFVFAVALFAIGGIAIGMLLSPRIGRLAERMDEDDGDGTD